MGASAKLRLTFCMVWAASQTKSLFKMNFPRRWKMEKAHLRHVHPAAIRDWGQRARLLTEAQESSQFQWLRQGWRPQVVIQHQHRRYSLQMLVIPFRRTKRLT